VTDRKERKRQNKSYFFFFYVFYLFEGGCGFLLCFCQRGKSSFIRPSRAAILLFVVPKLLGVECAIYNAIMLLLYCWKWKVSLSVMTTREGRQLPHLHPFLQALYDYCLPFWSHVPPTAAASINAFPGEMETVSLSIYSSILFAQLLWNPNHLFAQPLNETLTHISSLFNSLGTAAAVVVGADGRRCILC
jgi:hypothetical protein